MKYYLHVIFLTVLTSTFIHAQWFSEKQSGIETHLASVHFANESTGWIVGASSVVLKTTDKGSNWTSQTIPGNCDFNSVYAIDENNVLAIGWGGGGRGAIFKTTDGGSNWLIQQVDQKIQYMSIFFVNENIGWIVGSGSTILKTTDGGINWSAQSIGTGNHLWFRSVYFVDQNTGWIVGENGSIFKTINGGETWNNQNSNISSYLYSVYFTDQENGWAVGEFGAILKTSNGGNSWTATYAGKLLHSIFFVDNNNGRAVGLDGKMVKTTDGGINWETEDSGTEQMLLSIYMLDHYTGWAVGYNGEILRANLSSSESNLVWNKTGDELPGGGTSWSTPLIMDNKLFWAGQDKGFVAMNAETGAILWKDTINFANGTYDSPVGFKGKVFISTNSFSDPLSKKLLALDAADGNILWQKNNFYTSNRSSKPITEDGKLYAASNDTLYCFDISNGNVIWQKAGKYSNMLIDYNGMRLFAARSDLAKIEVFYPHNGELIWSINLPDAGVSIASLAYNYIQSKEFLVVAPGTRQKAIFYCIDIAAQNVIWKNENIGFVGNKSAPVIYQDKVFVGVEKTTSNSSQEVVSFDLLTGNIIWQNVARGNGATNTPYVLVLDGKVYYHSSENDLNTIVAVDLTNGNTLWNTDPKFQFAWPLVWGSPLIDDNKLYVAKDHEGVFCFNAGAVNGEWTMLGGNRHATNSYSKVFVSVNDEIILPIHYNLHQNYPNPFNPSTTIKYDLTREEFVKIKIFDLLGREIMTAVSELKSAGSHNFKFDAFNLSTGVYLYSIEAGNYIQTKKMILLK